MLTVSIVSSYNLKKDFLPAATIKIELTDDTDNISEENTDQIIEAEFAPSTLLSSTVAQTIEEVNLASRKLVALTFDDGPSKYTDELLDVLEQNNVKATFFVLGCYCDDYPEVLKRMAEDGHEIAIHGETHTAFTNLTLEEVDKEITTTIDYMESLGINPSYLVRPPYGSLNNSLRENINYPFVLWNIDTEDWKTKDNEQIKMQILENIDAGSIILMHDTAKVHEVDVEVLAEILPELTKDYCFVTISELSERYNIDLEAGNVYTKIKSEN